MDDISRCWIIILVGRMIVVGQMILVEQMILGGLEEYISRSCLHIDIRGGGAEEMRTHW